MKIKRYLTPVLLAIAAWGASLVINACTQSPPSSTTTSAPPASTAPAKTEHAGHSNTKKININSAILSELDKLEAKLGIPALSHKIQAERPYKSAEDLVAKKVLDQSQFDRVKEMVTIEEIVLTGEAKDVDYAVKLGLMKGHMMVAKELLDLQKPKEAEPHIGHPVEEIYADVEDQLKERKIAEFKTPLVALQDFVKAGAKDSGKVTTNFKSSVQSIDGAIAALPAEQRQSPKFALQVINGLLDTANAEYGAAIADGKIREAIEYQDSRGFVFYAEELYKATAANFAQKNPDLDKLIVKNMKELKLTWPTPMPPAKPVKTVEEVTKLVKEIESSYEKVKAS
jgi:hypothetical protein